MSLDNLLLISLRSEYLDSSKVYSPLGLLYLKSAVEQEMDINIDLMDDYDLNDVSIFEPYDVIGLSVMTPQREEAKRVLKTIKSNHPNKKVIIGGPHAMHYFNEVEKQDYDYIVTNDGQRSLIKILKGNGERVEIDIMDKQTFSEQPKPDRTSNKARKFLSNYSYSLQGKKAGTMLTATGCPQKCGFCEEAQTKVRWRNLESLASEMDDLIELGYEGVYLFDDLFAIAMPKIKPILKELKKRNLIFRCNGQANYFTKWEEEFAELLSSHGCAEIAFGHESGSQKILDNANKQTTIEQNYKSIEYAKKYGIHVKSFLMLGLPGEDKETLSQTEDFIRDGGMDDFQLAVFYPYKGTKIRDNWDRGIKQDFIFEGEGLGAYGQKGGKSESVVRTKELSSTDLLEFRDYLVYKYKPKSHSTYWDDKFFEVDKNE